MDFEKLTDRARGLPAGRADDRGPRASSADRAGAFAQGAARRRAGHGGGADPGRRRRSPRRRSAKSMRWSPKIPAVTGSGATQAPALDGDTIRILDQAEQIAKKAGDSYVTVERILLAMALAKNTDVGGALAKAGPHPAEPQRRDRQAARRPHRRHASRRRTATTRSRNSRATSPRRRARASSTRSSAATRKSAAPSRCSPAGPRTIRC